MHTPKYCPKCHVSVAPFDRQQITVDNATFHTKCWERTQPVNNCKVKVVNRHPELKSYTFVTYEEV